MSLTSDINESSSTPDGPIVEPDELVDGPFSTIDWFWKNIFFKH